MERPTTQEPTLPRRPDRFFAHSAAKLDHWEPLHVHLAAVAERAERHATIWGGGVEARVTGMCHDLGKYGEPFLARLAGKASGLDHWSIGAWAVATRYTRSFWAAALAIQGHHVGLQAGNRDALRRLRPDKLQPRERHPQGLELTTGDSALVLGRLGADGLSLPESYESVAGTGTPFERMLATRMLFSALVDADHLETEAHFAGAGTGCRVYRDPAPQLDPARAFEAVMGHLRSLRMEASAEVLRVRREVLEACVETAVARPGLFTLTAPTGAGKTLAMLAFALRHAAEHGLRRVVVALPYLSILGQTARTYRELLSPLFGDDYVLEHHSLVAGDGPEADRSAEGERDEQSDRARRQRLLAQSWESPLVVTTSVQLLESLFASKPMRCRKLHNLSGAVILLDEVQTLPVRLAVLTLASLSRLADRFGSTIVCVTATQPAFETLDSRVRHLAGCGWQPRELVRDSASHFQRLRRTRVGLELDPPIRWDVWGERIAAHRQALAIVNLKRHARELAEAVLHRGLRDGLFHLSTNLCPLHRTRVLEEVGSRLRRSAPCHLVATQCVEAGVDLDFPAGFRAFGPLDAIAQAAGRVNRNGRRDLEQLLVVKPDDPRGLYPPGAYEQAASVSEAFVRDRRLSEIDLADLELFRAYFQRLYALTGEIDAWRTKELGAAIEAFDFAAIGKLYQLIPDSTVEVLVPFEPATFAALREEAQRRGHLTRDWIRRARPHAVSVYRSAIERGSLGQLVEEVVPPRDGENPDWFACLRVESYDNELWGLVELEHGWIA